MPGPSSVFDRWLWRWGLLERGGPRRVHVKILSAVVAFHLIALLACVPWLFSWSGLAWAVGGLYLFGTLGINVGYHRLLTHRGFACPRWLEHLLALIGACCWQGSPMGWVAVHRMHHQHSDEPGDPHSPRASFFWSHVGWILIYDPALYNLSTYDRYARDLIRDRFYKWLERPRVWRNLHLIQWATFFAAGALVGGLWSWGLLGALQMGLSWLVWGVFLRTVLVWHITWSVNSVTHLWGYRTHDTADDSRNNWLVGLYSNGEGWHNNHHADPRCAAHGQRWWELDVSYLTIRALELVGLAGEVVRPRRVRPQQQSPEEPKTAA
jgi:stearoyl-CoA desaturase (delta-9 desaturase)